MSADKYYISACFRLEPEQYGYRKNCGFRHKKQIQQLRDDLRRLFLDDGWELQKTMKTSNDIVMKGYQRLLIRPLSITGIIDQDVYDALYVKLAGAGYIKDAKEAHFHCLIPDYPDEEYVKTCMEPNRREILKDLYGTFVVNPPKGTGNRELNRIISKWRHPRVDPDRKDMAAEYIIGLLGFMKEKGVLTIDIPRRKAGLTQTGGAAAE